ncbi:MAG: hypothetical protein ACPF8V_10185 [Luteibaculum sp.]
MDKSSVVHFLRIQEVQLENQLKALRQTMALIEGNQNGYDSHVSLSERVEPAKTATASAPVQAVQEEEKEAAPKGPKNKLVGKAEVNGRKVRPVKLPKSYDSNLSYTRKLAYLLAEKGPQTSQDLIKEVEKLEPSEDKDKIARSVTITASAMFRKGLVKAKRKGRAYLYSI